MTIGGVAPKEPLSKILPKRNSEVPGFKPGMTLREPARESATAYWESEAESSYLLLRPFGNSTSVVPMEYRYTSVGSAAI